VFEPLPNWHPAAVHFPIALTITASLLLVAVRLGAEKVVSGLAASARLMLSLAALSAVIAVLLGWQAFASVAHDAAGHEVMLRHRNWALIASSGLLGLALWDGWRRRSGRPGHALLLPASLLVAGCFAFTGWLGGEMVYRHGVAVAASAFACPPQPACPEAVPPVSEAIRPTPEPVGSTHIHRDGSRHRH
jgi:uncharacterized membrane protein